MINEYDEFADIYDYDLGKTQRDVELYTHMVKGSKQILILSCGTGREAEYLSGYVDQICGLDISEKMLIYAKERTKNISNITYINSNMINFNINQKFDHILIPNNGILHLLELNQIEDCLNCCKKHLTSEGTIILDFFLPDYKALSSVKSEKIHDFTVFDKKKDLYITRERIHSRDIFKRLNHTQIFYEFIDNSGTLTKRICNYTIRYLFPEELELISRLLSLRIVNKFGGFNFQKYDETICN